MNNLLRKKTNELSKKNKKGFTLIELIIVIAIIAILAAIAIPKFGSVRQNANVSSDVANAKNISLAVSKAIAEDKVTIPAGGISNATLNSVGTADIRDEVDGVTDTTKLKTTGHTDQVFVVDVSVDGNVTVKAGSGGAEIYPNPSADFQTK